MPLVKIFADKSLSSDKLNKLADEIPQILASVVSEIPVQAYVVMLVETRYVYTAVKGSGENVIFIEISAIPLQDKVKEKMAITILNKITELFSISVNDVHLIFVESPEKNWLIRGGMGRPSPSI